MFNRITSIKEWKQYNENVLIPRNIDGRKEKLLQDNIKLLSQEVIEGNLTIDKTFEGIPEELIKVKEISGGVLLDLNYIPSWLKDVKIYGRFDCYSNKLKSLENCPQYVGGDFYCFKNYLNSLEGCPKYIGGNIWCDKYLTIPKNVIVKGRRLY